MGADPGRICLHQPYRHVRGARDVAAGPHPESAAARVGDHLRDQPPLVRRAARPLRRRCARGAKPHHRGRLRAHGKPLPCRVQDYQRRLRPAWGDFAPRPLPRCLRAQPRPLYLCHQRHRPPPLARPVQPRPARARVRRARQRSLPPAPRGARGSGARGGRPRRARPSRGDQGAQQAAAGRVGVPHRRLLAQQRRDPRRAGQAPARV